MRRGKILGFFVALLIALGIMPAMALADTPIDQVSITVNGFSEGARVGDASVTVDTPVEGLSDPHTTFVYRLQAGSGWEECVGDETFDPHKVYAVRVFMYPQSGYSTDSLVKANVQVDGEEATYFFNPAATPPPGYPDNTFRIFHYLPKLDPDREQVWIDFDLDGGSPDPAHPDDYNPRYTAFDYKQGDTVSPLEFAFFDGTVPVKAGSTFKGWKYDLYDEPGSTLLSSSNRFVFENGVWLDVPAVGHYRICLVADWGGQWR